MKGGEFLNAEFSQAILDKLFLHCKTGCGELFAGQCQEKGVGTPVPACWPALYQVRLDKTVDQARNIALCHEELLSELALSDTGLLVQCG